MAKKQTFKGMSSLAAAISSARAEREAEEARARKSLDNMSQRAEPVAIAASAPAGPAAAAGPTYKLPKKALAEINQRQKQIAEAGALAEEKVSSERIEAQTLRLDTVATKLQQYLNGGQYSSMLVLMRTVMPRMAYGVRNAGLPLLNAVLERVRVSPDEVMTKQRKAALSSQHDEIATLLDAYVMLLLRQTEERRVVAAAASAPAPLPPHVTKTVAVRGITVLIETKEPLAAPYPAGVEKVTGQVFIVKGDMVGTPFFDPEIALVDKKTASKKRGTRPAVKAKKSTAKKAVDPDKALSREYKKVCKFAAAEGFTTPLESRVTRPNSDGVWYLCVPTCFNGESIARVAFPDRLSGLSTGGSDARVIEAALRKRRVAQQKALRLAFAKANEGTLREIRALKDGLAEIEARRNVTADKFKAMVGLPPTVSEARLHLITEARLRATVSGERSLQERVQARLDWLAAQLRVKSVRSDYMMLRAAARNAKSSLGKAEDRLEQSRREWIGNPDLRLSVAA